MKKFFVLLVAAMCFTGFYSCENNDDEGNQNNPPVQNYLTDAMTMRVIRIIRLFKIILPM